MGFCEPSCSPVASFDRRGTPRLEFQQLPALGSRVRYLVWRDKEADRVRDRGSRIRSPTLQAVRARHPGFLQEFGICVVLPGPQGDVVVGGQGRKSRCPGASIRGGRRGGRRDRPRPWVDNGPKARRFRFAAHPVGIQPDEKSETGERPLHDPKIGSIQCRLTLKSHTSQKIRQFSGIGAAKTLTHTTPPVVSFSHGAVMGHCRPYREPVVLAFFV